MSASFKPGLQIGAMAIAAILAGCGGGGSGAANTNVYFDSSVTIGLNTAYPYTIASGSRKRYDVNVTPGMQYVASLTGIVGEADLRVYTDGTFATQTACAAPNTVQPGAAPEDCIVTATGGTLYLTVTNPGAASNSYRIRVAPKNNAAAASEGSSLAPIALVPGVPHPGTVDTLALASSYYTVTTTGPASISMIGLQSPQDIDIQVYSNPDFTTGPQTCAYAPLAGVAPEECALASGGTWYIRVTNNAVGVGGPYLLTAD